MARRLANLRPGALLLALVIAVILWGLAHGASSIEREFDVPIELEAISDELVVTDQTPKHINVRIMGSQAALRNVDSDKLRYPIDVSGSKPGDADFEVDVSNIALPRGARIVSRSPSRIFIHFEPRGRKAVGIRVDTSGELPQGYMLERVEVLPSHVWLTGARGQVLRLREVVTEPIDLSSVDVKNAENAKEEREVSLLLGAGTVRMEKQESVRVVLHIAPEPNEGSDSESLLDSLEES
ncbi:MAG: YbbR-like domain-containing protein [Deltaproteobacteria bacterium]|nr:YbbR-like domain-containing protein [Deltaproteobacteria bacterium]